MIDKEEIRGLSVEEINEKINECRKEHFNLRVQLKTGKLEQNSKIKEVKKDIARLETIKKEKQLKVAK